MFQVPKSNVSGTLPHLLLRLCCRQGLLVADCARKGRATALQPHARQMLIPPARQSLHNTTTKSEQPLPVQDVTADDRVCLSQQRCIETMTAHAATQAVLDFSDMCAVCSDGHKVLTLRTG